MAWARISNDSETVCFSRDFGGKEEHQLFTIALEDGEEEEQLTQLTSTRVFDFNWSNGDDRLTFAGATKEANGLWIVDSSNGIHTQVYQNRHWVFSPEWSRDTGLHSKAWLGEYERRMAPLTAHCPVQDRR